MITNSAVVESSNADQILLFSQSVPTQVKFGTNVRESRMIGTSARERFVAFVRKWRFNSGFAEIAKTVQKENPKLRSASSFDASRQD